VPVGDRGLNRQDRRHPRHCRSVGLLRSAQRGSRYAVRRLRRPSQTKNVSAHSASARRRAIRGWIASLSTLLAPLAGWRFVPLPSSLACRRKACRLARSSRTAARQPCSARIALCSPPTSSSLADEKRVCSLRLSTAARDPGLDLLRSVHCSLRSLAGASCRCFPHSLAEERRVCALVRPGQRRASLAQRGSRHGVRRLRRPSQTKNVSGSLPISTAARDPDVVLRPIRRGAGEESDCRDEIWALATPFGAPL